MEQWIDKDDCENYRSNSKYDLRIPGSVVLMDATEGYRIFILPESFTDDQVWECLRVANIAYAKGYEHGEEGKAREIRDALFIL